MDFGYIFFRRAFVEAIEDEHNGVARITECFERLDEEFIELLLSG